MWKMPSENGIGKTSISDKETFYNDYGFDVDSFHPMRYYWDNFGIEASTCDQESLHNIVIFLRKSKHPLPTAECAFSGILYFDGH